MQPEDQTYFGDHIGLIIGIPSAAIQPIHAVSVRPLGLVMGLRDVLEDSAVPWLMDHIGEYGVWALIDKGRNIVEMVWVQPIERNLWDAFAVKTILYVQGRN